MHMASLTLSVSLWWFKRCHGIFMGIQQVCYHRDGCWILFNFILDVNLFIFYTPMRRDFENRTVYIYKDNWMYIVWTMYLNLYLYVYAVCLKRFGNDMELTLWYPSGAVNKLKIELSISAFRNHMENKETFDLLYQDVILISLCKLDLNSTHVHELDRVWFHTLQTLCPFVSYLFEKEQWDYAKCESCDTLICLWLLESSYVNITCVIKSWPVSTWILQKLCPSFSPVPVSLAFQIN